MRFNIFLFATFLLSLSYAQYTIKPCKSFPGQNCLLNSIGREDLTIEDIDNLKAAVKRDSEFPWLSVLDANNDALKHLLKLQNKISKSAKKQEFIEALTIFELSKSPDVLLKAFAIAMSLPRENKHSFTLNSSNPELLNDLIRLLNRKEKQSDSGPIQKCKDMDQEIFGKILDQKQLCGRNLEKTINGDNFYRVLAEIIACTDNEIDRIGVIEDSKVRSITRDCYINFPESVDTSSAIGTLQVRFRGEIKEIQWSAGHDITPERANNTLDIWRKQLYPKVNALIDPSNKSPGPGTIRGVDPTSGRR